MLKRFCANQIFQKCGTNMAKPVTLSEAQKKVILERYKEINNLNTLTAIVWNDETLDGRSKQGQAVKQFLVDSHLAYETTKKKIREDIPPLTDEQKDLILLEAENNSNITDITRLVYRDETIQRLSKEWRQVQAFIKSQNPELIDGKDDVAVGAFNAPKDQVRLVNLVNEALGTTISPEKISGKYKAYFDKLAVNLSNSKFRRIINAYESKRDRDLFIDEFIRLTFEKPDLTPDELNLYFQIIRDGNSLEVLESKINKMNNFFLEIEEASELKQSFSENLKACVDEKNQITKRIADTTKKLQGDRGERLKNQNRDDASFLTIVQMAQEEEGRKRMMALAKLQKAAISEEANRLETMDSLLCEIFGFEKEDII